MDIKKIMPVFFLFMAGTLLTFSAKAENTPSGLAAHIAAMPEYKLKPADETHFMLRLSPRKSRVIHLDEEAAKATVDDPAHLSVFIDDPKKIIILARSEGVTHFTVTGKDGKTIMSRYVIVSASREKYIRARFICAQSKEDSCGKPRIYYCSDQCYQTQIFGADQNSQKK